MIIDLASPAKNKYSSFYHLSFCTLNKGMVYILGADEVLHKLIKEKLISKAETFIPTTIRNLYISVPGHYALIFTEEDKTTLVTDPYGIIKLYRFQKNGRTIICDDVNEVRGEQFKLDHQAIKFFFICNYTPSKHTFLKELSKLEPCSIYVYENDQLVQETLYANLGNVRLFGKDFLNRYFTDINTSLSFYYNHYDKACLFLSGGIDSSFLYKLLCTGKKEKWLDLLVGQCTGLNQQHKIDNDYDIEYSSKLAKEHNHKLFVIPYDFSASNVVNDFTLLNDYLFTEYAPALGYLGYVRSVDISKIIINGQNADSILSFGSMGFPYFQSGKIKGLNGFFSRYFYFFGHVSRPSLTSFFAHCLRWIYYKKSYPSLCLDFSEKSYFLGIGLHPENKYFYLQDPVFGALHEPNEMAVWFQQKYLTPLLQKYDYLDHHALSVLLYNKTYMQGSANRSTVLSSLIQGRKIFLPYTSLPLLELMTNLKPDWHYAFYGKYPNIEVGRKYIGLADYIIKRSDPNNSDSTILLYNTLLQNKVFMEFLIDVLEKTDWLIYEGILKSETIERLKSFKEAITPKDLPVLMRLIWIDSLLQKFHIS